MTKKLPKQWKHWCKKAGLKIYCRKYPEECIIGKDRHYRVIYDSNGELYLQSSVVFSEFDRWANSVYNGIEFPPTRRDFLYSVQQLRG